MTGLRSSIRSSRANNNASRASVLTRSPGARRIFDGAATSHRIPAAVRSRARPNPVGPASYVTATGPGSSASHAMIAAESGRSRCSHTCPVTESRPAAATDRACTSKPTLVRSVEHRGLPTTHVG